MSSTKVSYYYSVYKKCISRLRFTVLIHISQRFVKGILSYYYKNDAAVQRDSELQKWIMDIFEHGFLSQAETGELKGKKCHICWLHIGCLHYII